MKYKENIETGQVIKYSDKTHGQDFRKAPWKDCTKEKYDNYKKAEDLKPKKAKKKDELRKAYIDSQIQVQLDAVNNATTEEELNNIN